MDNINHIPGQASYLGVVGQHKIDFMFVSVLFVYFVFRENINLCGRQNLRGTDRGERI